MMIEWQHISAKCPNKDCNSIFKIKQGGFPFANDSGGWKLKCNSCKHEFIVHLINPIDLSSVEDGVEIIEAREGTLEETKEWSKDEDLPIEPIETFIYTPEEIKPLHYFIDEFPLYMNSKNENLEKLAYDCLEKHLTTVEKENYSYYQGFVKGKWGDPKYGYILIDFENNGDKHTAIFYYNFTRRNTKDFPKVLSEILLAHITNTIDFTYLINGIYTRDNCLSYLNKLLIRWRGLYKYTVIVVPFIGYLNQKPKTRIELWDDIKKFLIEPNSILFTRHIAKGLLKKSEEKIGIPTNLIKEFKVESKAFKNMSLFNLFHAKFFGGVNDDYTEVLKGSFNIQKNLYFENLDFSLFETSFFKERYLEPLEIILEDKEELKDAIVIDLRSDKPKLEIEYDFCSGLDLVKKYTQAN